MTSMGEGRCLPPLIKADVAIVIHVDLVKEASKPPLWDSEASFLERRSQLVASNFAIMVSIYGSEEQDELALSSFDKDAELCIALNISACCENSVV